MKGLLDANSTNERRPAGHSAECLVHPLACVPAMKFHQLGPYKIGKLLGRGGMGAVYTALDTRNDTPAAVKVLSAAMAHEEGFRERFSAEIESLRKLSHPNIVQLHGFGEQDDILFYGMEFVEGKSLEEEIHGGRKYGPSETIDVGVQVCRALRHAHDRGIVHRDIKPANIIHATDGTIKLLDFGIAKLFGNTGMTGDGGVLGTAEFMSPEQAEGRPVNYRCDLYSLGCVLYTLLAERPPFQARSMVEMLQMQRFEDPEPLHRLAYEVPPELEELIASLMEKSPENRIANAAVLARRLESIRPTPTPPTDNATDPQKSKTFVPGSVTIDGSLPPPPGQGPTVSDDEYQLADPKIASPPLSDSGFAVTMASDAPAPESAGSGASESKTNLARSTTRPTSPTFTTIDRSEHARAEAIVEQEGSWISLHTWALVAGLVATAAVIWYSIQPPTANQLYGKIIAAAEGSNSEGLSSVEDEIERFLALYPHESRAEQARRYLDEIELDRLERRFDLRRRLGRLESLPPIEQAYFEAVNYARLDVDVGIAKMEAFVNLYAPEGASENEPACLTLARRQVVRLRQQSQEYAADHLALIRRNLERAEEIHVEDVEAAERIWRDIVNFYEGKPWAAAEIQEARARLDTSRTVGNQEPGRTLDEASGP